MIEKHEKLGERGSATINTNNRADARQWLSGLGISSHLYNSLNVGQLTEAYNDTTDAVVTSLKTAVASPSFPPPPTVPDAEARLRQLQELLGGTAPTVDLDPVYESIGKIETVLSSAVADVGDRVSTIEGLADDIRTLTAAIKSDKGGAARAATVARSATNPVLAKLTPFYSAGKYNGGIAVSLESPAGFGKSHAIRALGEEYAVYLEHGCSEDIDEIGTLLGSITPDGAGGFVTVDGVLTEAVRAASDGKSTLLLLDEHLRWGARTQEFLLTFLTGFTRGGTLYYRLRTRRPEGTTLEVLECEARHLHIVAASNLEQRVPRGPYWDRFHHVRVDFDTNLLRDVCHSILDAHGITGLVNLPLVFAATIGESRKAAAAGQVQYPLSPRVLLRAAVTAPEPTEAAVATAAANAVADHCQAWDADTGDRAHDDGVIAGWVKSLKNVATHKVAKD